MVVKVIRGSKWTIYDEMVDGSIYFKLTSSSFEKFWTASLILLRLTSL